MLYYKVNSLDALDKIKEVSYYTLKDKAIKKGTKTFTLNSYKFI